MPDQRDVLKKLVGKKETELSDDSDEETLPFVGTSLYGLMTSPKKKGISLMNISSPKKSTRAAAGFRHPTKMKVVQRATSPTIKRESRLTDMNSDSTASEDDGDDLDGPISAPKFSSSIPNTKKDIVDTNPTTRLPSVQKPKKSGALPSLISSARLGTNDSNPPKAPVADSSSHPSTTKDRIARRIAQTKLVKKQEEEEKKKLDIIPTFL
ncbi:hypothetical protein NHQ30_002530 [Ciborinia camelliae]|nr:hypothetical protein NHQ30_002530 [Ciborinia camelliae]